MPNKVEEKWVIIWFPPDVPKREKAFNDEQAARYFATIDPVAPWYPSLVYRKVTTTVEERILVPVLHLPEEER